MAKKVRVAVLLGGKSNEHSISVASAGGVMGALDTDNYELIPIGITKKGEFVPFDVAPKKLALSEGLQEIKSMAQALRLDVSDKNKKD